MLWLITATVCAYFVKGLCGFANTLVFTTILGFTMNNINISPLEVLLGYPTNVILAWKERKNLGRKIWLPLTALVIAGSLPGIFLLKNADAGIIKLIFGFVVVFIGLEMLVREFIGKESKGSKPVLITIGILSGILCGLYGVGALLAAYVNRVTKDNGSFKANMCAVFIIENMMRICIYAATGIITPEILKNAAILMPFMLAGLFLGIKSSAVLNEKTAKKAVTAALIVSGAALIIENLP